MKINFGIYNNIIKLMLIFDIENNNENKNKESTTMKNNKEKFVKNNLKAREIILDSPLKVKAVKTFRGRDGEGFNCNIYWDGKRIGVADDMANGGELHLEFWKNLPFEPLVELRNSVPKGSWYWRKREGEGVDWNISGIIHYLVEDFLDRKELKKMLKNVTIYDPKKNTLASWKVPSENLFSKKYNFKEEKGINLWDYIEKYHKSYVVLNGLTMDDAMKYWNLAYFNSEV
tara:strand:+ start:285 stop:974 length:690 start_codon:yes stop_codon:yes gene_type:complete